MIDPPDFRALARTAVAAADGDPADVGLLLHAAEMLLRADDPDRALAFAHDAVAADASSVRAVRVLSGMLDAAGERGAAIRFGEQAVRLDPADAELRLHLGGLLAAERRWREAAEHLSVHVVAPAATAQGWRLLSSVLQQAGDTQRATDAGRHAITADPNAIEYRVNLVSLLSVRAQFDLALDELAIALAQAPENALVWRARSGVLAALGRLGEAMHAAEYAVALAPDDPECRRQRAYIAGLCELPAASQGEAAAWTITPRRRRIAPRPGHGIADEIAIRWRVAYAIVLRDIRTQFGHTRLGYLWAILEPISHLLTLGMVFFSLNSSPPPVGDNLFLFYVTGLMPFLMFSHVSHDVMGSAEANNVLLMLPIVKRTDVMVAQAVRQLATELCVGIVIFSVSGLLGEQALPADMLTSAAAILLLWLLALGVGAISLVVAEAFPSYRTFYDALMRLMYFASGIYYSPLAMPDWIRAWLEWNPILQAIEYFRSGFYPQYEPHWLDVNYLLLWVLASVGIGFAMERAMRGKMAVHT